MEFKQVYTPGLAHCSYVIGGKSACVVIDPAREVKQYIAIAKSLGLPIKGIIETHLHADFVSGHVELKQLTGATIYVTAKANAEFEHHLVKDEEEFQIDTLLFKMLDTPGHTPESTVYLVTDLERGNEPVVAFTGDTLLVGDVGRPDLFPDKKEELASKLYRSLRRLEKLGDYIEVYPAHGAGSLCGKALSSKLSSTIGTEKLQNTAMLKHPEEAFIKSFLKEMPEAPDHFSRCSELNRRGAMPVSEVKRPVAFSPEKFLECSQHGYIVVDTRDQLAFASAHVPGAYALSLKGNFATFAGWVLPPDQPILLVLEDRQDMQRVLRALYSVGLDNVTGFLKGGMPAYAASGLITARFESVSASEAKERYEEGSLRLIDNRLKSEWDRGHIQGSSHVPAPDVRHNFHQLEGNKTLAFICNSGNRSLLAASLMLNFSKAQNVINVIGGMTAWLSLGYPLVAEDDEN
ncbi:MBL fold metallo-hydrolase [Gottschalkiaceae bacterium SANA]|nr:MBL fold metallo-hydrolase [Gottschalkiaceae bacterium SANA]